MIENKIKQGGLDPFCLPQGPKGDKGDKGDTGPQGPKGDPGVCPPCNCYFYLGHWNATNKYPLTFNGCTVYVSSGEKMYQNLIDNNLGNTPNCNPTKWLKIF